MNKNTEGMTRSLQIAATLTLTKSATALLDMAPYKKAVFNVAASKPIDATTFSGNITVTVYENTNSTWGGATALTSFVKTAVCNSSSAGFSVVEVNDYDMSCNGDQQYLGVYVAAWTKTDMFAIVERIRGDNEPLE